MMAFQEPEDIKELLPFMDDSKDEIDLVRFRSVVNPKTT